MTITLDENHFRVLLEDWKKNSGYGRSYKMFSYEECWEIYHYMNNEFLEKMELTKWEFTPETIFKMWSSYNCVAEFTTDFGHDLGQGVGLEDCEVCSKETPMTVSGRDATFREFVEWHLEQYKWIDDYDVIDIRSDSGVLICDYTKLKNK